MVRPKITRAGTAMDTPDRQAAISFTQPVRQIVLMLAVVGLVVAGGILAYARIFPIFLANVWLNGVILGVFVLGVLSTFWQVAQLVRSVSWIEGFAVRRPGHELTQPPQLLVALAALLRARGSRAQIANSSARSILESVATRIDEARDITRYMANLLIFLGLLGTFYGLATTVPAVVDTIRALAPQEGESPLEVFDKLMSGLEQQLGGMGTAFSSSLLGLAGSLVVGLLELFATHGQNRFYRELEEWLSSITRLSFAAAEGDGGGTGEVSVVAEILDSMVEQMDALRALHAQADAGRTMVNQRIAALADAVEGLTGRLEDDVGQLAALDRIAEGQDRIADLLARRIGEGGGGDGGIDAESRMRLRSIDVQLLRLLEEVAAGRQESVADLRADIAQLTKAVRGLGTTGQARRGP